MDDFKYKGRNTYRNFKHLISVPSSKCLFPKEAEKVWNNTTSKKEDTHHIVVINNIYYMRWGSKYWWLKINQERMVNWESKISIDNYWQLIYDRSKSIFLYKNRFQSIVEELF